MISGIGCDIVDIARIKKACLRQPKFCETVLSQSEQPVYAVRCEASEERDIAISQAAGQQKKHSQKRLVQDFAEP